MKVIFHFKLKKHEDCLFGGRERAAGRGDTLHCLRIRSLTSAYEFFLNSYNCTNMFRTSYCLPNAKKSEKIAKFKRFEFEKCLLECKGKTDNVLVQVYAEIKIRIA